MKTLQVVNGTPDDLEAVRDVLGETYEIVPHTTPPDPTTVTHVLVLIHESNEFFSGCNWLLEGHDTHSYWIWVYAPTISEQERLMLYQLGVLGILGTIQEVGYVLHTIDEAPKKKRHALEKGADAFHLHEDTLSVTYHMSKVAFTRLEYSLISLLYTHRNQVCTYEALGKHLWGEKAKGTERYRVANLVFHIREKLGDSNEKLIRTIRSKGYLLALPED